MTFKTAAAMYLKTNGPTYYKELTENLLKGGYISSKGKTPARTMLGVISADIKKNKNSPFVLVGDGVIDLKTSPPQEKLISRPSTFTVIKEAVRIKLGGIRYKLSKISM